MEYKWGWWQEKSLKEKVERAVSSLKMAQGHRLWYLVTQGGRVGEGEGDCGREGDHSVVRGVSQVQFSNSKNKKF